MTVAVQDKVYLFTMRYADAEEAVIGWWPLMTEFLGDHCDWRTEFELVTIQRVGSMYKNRDGTFQTAHYRVVLHFDWDHKCTSALREALRALKDRSPWIGIEHYSHVMEEDYGHGMGLEAQWQLQPDGTGIYWHNILIEEAEEAQEAALVRKRASETVT